MATEKAIVEEVNNSKLRLAPAIDFAQEKMKDSHIPSYGALKGYSDKVLDISKKVEDSIMSVYEKSKNLYKSLTGNISDSYNLQSAYALPGKDRNCGYC